MVGRGTIRRPHHPLRPLARQKKGSLRLRSWRVKAPPPDNKFGDEYFSQQEHIRSPWQTRDGECSKCDRLALRGRINIFATLNWSCLYHTPRLINTQSAPRDAKLYWGSTGIQLGRRTRACQQLRILFYRQKHAPSSHDV